jgi:hypothetical protein
MWLKCKERIPVTRFRTAVIFGRRGQDRLVVRQGVGRKRENFTPELGARFTGVDFILIL